MQEKMEICQYLPCGLIKKRRAAKFESLRLTAFYQILWWILELLGHCKSAQLETAPTKHGVRKCLFIFIIYYKFGKLSDAIRNHLEWAGSEFLQAFPFLS